MEGDASRSCWEFWERLFQSTPSAWRETRNSATNWTTEPFQSTPSAWRETNRLTYAVHHSDISIHSLRMEGDLALSNQNLVPCYFNPLPPHGGRLKDQVVILFPILISIHSLRMEGDGDRFRAVNVLCISIHSLRMEGDVPAEFCLYRD